MREGPSREDLYLFGRGTLHRAHRVFGAQPLPGGGARFAVWAPHARRIRVTGTFNGWDGAGDGMERLEESGVWTGVSSGAAPGDLYKYEVETADGERFLKADPYAREAELRPATASLVPGESRHTWQDGEWMAARGREDFRRRPMNIYEVHLGSWRRGPDGAFLGYRDLAEQLPEYVARMGHTHVEFLPLTEHPYDASWGYQGTGYFAPTRRHGDPDGLRSLVDRLHQAGIGVLLDWVPGHFCRDAHGLARFDGTPLYEYADPLRAEQPGWGTLCFDLGKHQVQSFLLSSALYWLEEFHFDGLRVDAVSSMLYRDFQREDGRWRRGPDGEREDRDGARFLQTLNQVITGYLPDVCMIAEESSAWPRVSGPVSDGGLGFSLKWNMGWMNDTLEYMQTDWGGRRERHRLLTFPHLYAYTEDFVLPLSHDEVVHGKRSLLGRMPGDYREQFAGLRLLLGYQMTQPGKKLLFMGAELGQFSEWTEERALEWFLLEYDQHRQLQEYVRDLNWFYREQESLWEQDHEPEGYRWLDPDNGEQSIVSYLRRDRRGRLLVVICNFLPERRPGFRQGVPASGRYGTLFCSDAVRYGGGGEAAEPAVRTEPVPWHGQDQSVVITVPPLAVRILLREEGTDGAADRGAPTGREEEE